MTTQNLDGDQVTRPTRTATWNLVRGGEPVASAYAVCRPDRLWYVSVDGWQDDDLGPLVAAMVDDLRHDLHTRIDAADPATLELWSRHGFVPHRREIEYVLNPDPTTTGLVDTPLPVGLVLLPADEVDEVRLRELDDLVRVDLPGSGSWVNDPAEFHDITFDDRFYDPETHLVAVDDHRRQFAGLVRVRSVGPRARLGLVAVTRPYRRQGLASAMLARVLRTVHDRAVTEVLAEADESDVASRALLQSIGARQTGASLVLVRHQT